MGGVTKYNQLSVDEIRQNHKQFLEIDFPSSISDTTEGQNLIIFLQLPPVYFGKTVSFSASERVFSALKLLASENRSRVPFNN